MTWQEMHDMVRAAYLEGVRAGHLHAVTDAEELQFMWECSDALRDLPESTTGPTPERGFLG